MKTFKTLSLITSLFFLLITSPNQLFGQESGYLLIRVYESADKAYHRIIVTENGKTIEEVDLNKFDWKELDVNQIKINNTLDKYNKMGYSITTSNTVLGGVYLLTTFVLKKSD